MTLHCAVRADLAAEEQRAPQVLPVHLLCPPEEWFGQVTDSMNNPELQSVVQHWCTKEDCKSELVDDEK